MNSIASRLGELLEAAGLESLPEPVGLRFADYFELLVRWNSKMNLTAIRDEDGILTRHFVESIACARLLPAGISTLLDFGSGAGFPGIPIALCRPEISVMLAESQGKKAAFLREAVRGLGIQVRVHSGRAEVIKEEFDCVVLRAVDRTEEMLPVAGSLIGREGWLALMTTGSELAALRLATNLKFDWEAELRLPGGDRRVLALARGRE